MDASKQETASMEDVVSADAQCEYKTTCPTTMIPSSERRRRAFGAPSNRFFSSISLFGTFCFLILFTASATSAATYRTENFVVRSTSAPFARKVGDAAENLREELAILWLGRALPRWSRQCEITVKAGVGEPAGGETVFTFSNGEVYDWKMRVQGTEERIIDSVLPHEITHTIIASYLRGPAPRWLDEGMATSVESQEERSRYRSMLVDFLRSKRGLAFNDMVSTKEYPDDLTPFYAQSFSVCEYLILLGGRRRLLEFVRETRETNNLNATLEKYYACESLGALQLEWVEWIKKWDLAGRPVNLPSTRALPDLDAESQREIALAQSRLLSIPKQQLDAGGQLLTVDEPRFFEPAVRLWDNVRGARARNDASPSQISRAQNRDSNGPRRPGWFPSDKTNPLTASRQSWSNSSQSFVPQRKPVTENVGSANGTSTSNASVSSTLPNERLLGDGAGSATSSAVRNDPIYYRPSKNSAYSSQYDPFRR